MISMRMTSGRMYCPGSRYPKLDVRLATVIVLPTMSAALAGQWTSRTVTAGSGLPSGVVLASLGFPVYYVLLSFALHASREPG